MIGCGVSSSNNKALREVQKGDPAHSDGLEAIIQGRLTHCALLLFQSEIESTKTEKGQALPQA